MAVTVKVLVARREEEIGYTNIVFRPNYANGANKEWAMATPTLEYRMGVRPEVAALFPIGSKWTGTFTPDEE